MNIHTESLAYRDGETPLTGHLALGGEGRRPGVLVLHGGAGLDAHARRQAERLAGLGYAALACDLYGDGIAGDRQRVLARIAELRGDRAALVRRIRAGLDLLAARPECDGRLAAVGYCFGGMAALELARSGAALAGAVSVHGTLTTGAPARPGEVRARVLVLHGSRDPHAPLAQVSAFAEEMDAAGADWQLALYGGAEHGFTHQGAPLSPGVAFHPAADARSLAAIRQFLGELFGA